MSTDCGSPCEPMNKTDNHYEASIRAGRIYQNDNETVKDKPSNTNVHTNGNDSFIHRFLQKRMDSCDMVLRRNSLTAS